MAEKVGFVGLGHMGHGMAKNVLEKGFPLTGLSHRKRETIEDLKQRGATEAASGKELAQACDIIVLCVTGSAQVELVLNGPDGLASAEKPLLVIDCSTSEPAITVRLAAELAPRGITLIDAPLSRTPKEAWAGTLDVMLGGAPEHVRRARPVIETFAGRIVETGPTGSAHMMKLLNNFVSLGYGALYAEALMMGAKAGVSSQTFHDVIAGGRMDCPFFRTFFEYVVGGNRDAHKFTLNNGLKDLTYLANFANSSGTANPVGAAIRNSYALAVGMGRGEGYVPMLTDAVANAAGLK